MENTNGGWNVIDFTNVKIRTKKESNVPVKLWTIKDLKVHDVFILGLI
jgi:hypothetical protein